MKLDTRTPTTPHGPPAKTTNSGPPPVQAATPNGQDPSAPTVSHENPYDLEKLRNSTDYEKLAPTKMLLMRTPVGKPDDTHWIRIHPGKQYIAEDVILYRPQNERDFYYVSPNVRASVEHLSLAMRRMTIYLVITNFGLVSLWPIGKDKKTGQYLNSWHRSAADVAGIAMTQWVRVMPDPEGQRYSAKYTLENFGEPEWSDRSMEKYLATAFEHYLIDSVEHAIIRGLQGYRT